MPEPYAFDRYLRHDELGGWLADLEATHPDLVTVETYGRSHEGRELRLVTVTDAATGPHHTKPAHWIDASIHAVELTATVAACRVLHHLVTGHDAGDPLVVEALRTRTFYVVPRVNPDGAELALADSPRWLRSSTRPWPWADGRRWPGLEPTDVDGDGRILQMRLSDPDGAWMAHPDDPRLLVMVPPEGPPAGTTRYRCLVESTGVDLDGFTLPTPPPAEGLDLNRNYPAGWATSITGSGDHPLSEPEIDAIVRAMAARPNICGFNAFHTSGGVLLRPSSTKPDRELPRFDTWAWGRLAERGLALTGYPAHSCFEDFTWERERPMSGASDDWAYEHLGVFGWTTEFWDVVHAATGERVSTDFWYVGATDDQRLAVLHWCDEQGIPGHVDWYPFDHPELGPVELGGWDDMVTWTNPPTSMLAAEVDGHGAFAVHQALCSPRIEIRRTEVEAIGDGTFQLSVGVANTGWLPTTVTTWAAKHDLVRPLVVSVDGDGIEVVGPDRVQLGQLRGRADLLFRHGHDGTPDRVQHRFVVRAAPGAHATVTAVHPRAGTATVEVTLS